MDCVRLVDKPPGESSFASVKAVRRDIGRARPDRAGRGSHVKVGHAGTLDPFATGLLIVLVGRATRAQRWFMATRKTYRVRARFGWVSSTGDPEGELTETGIVPTEPLVLPTGIVRQRPPAYSAIKVDGERAYARARRGEAVEVPEREVTVYRFDRLSDDEFEIECSSGTYVRSLIADLGDAYCTELRRTAIGPFGVEDAGTELSLGAALARVLPVIELAGEDARAAAHGRAVVHRGEEPEALLVDADGPIAIAARQPSHELKPVVGFRGS